jgi:glutathione S-transferase
MLVVHHLRPSRAERILWLLEEIGLPYEVVAYDRTASFRSPPELSAVHPLGKSPVLTDGELVLVESGAIVEHLVEHHAPRLAPAPGSAARPRYLEWMHWAEGSAAAWLVMDFVLNGGLAPGVVPGPLAESLPAEIGRGLDWVEGELAGHDYACGDEFTAADTMLGWALAFARDRGHVGERKAILSYLARIEDRPAHRRARERAA